MDAVLTLLDEMRCYTYPVSILDPQAARNPKYFEQCKDEIPILYKWIEHDRNIDAVEREGRRLKVDRLERVVMSAELESLRTRVDEMEESVKTASMI